MKTKRIAWRIYELTLKGRTFQIDGQNHEGQSNEWELFEAVDSQYGSLPDMVWIETYLTKKEALEDIARWV